ncbi:MAG TPA: phosphoribosylglycinamide formyltransferase [Spirochaetes bacterium]|nr:phosphoribosylglycinamide formyltransferase [Spirochaetota bacterium]
MSPSENPFRIGFLLSGNGSTLENLLEHIADGQVDAKIAVVLSSRTQAYGLIRANNWGIPHEVVPYKMFKSNLNDYSQRITQLLDFHKVDLVVFGGFMSCYIVPKHYINRVINIHPSLIPSFCGKGFYGTKVHQTVLDYGVKVTGVTVHFVDDEYDHGPIIAQETVKIDDRDTVDSIQSKVTAIEKRLYPKVIQAIIEDKITIENRKVRWIE